MEEQRPRPSQRRSGTDHRPAAPRDRSGSARKETPQRRRRRRGGARAAAKALLYVVIVIGVSVALAAAAWVMAGDVLALNKPEHSAVVVLPESAFTEKTVTAKEKNEDGETVEVEKTVREVDLDYVADLLKENGVIEYKGVFKLFAAFTKSKTKMAPGTYTLTHDMDYRSIISSLGAGSGSRVEVSVTIPEGYTVAQIFSLMEEKGVSTVEKLNDMAANHDYKFDFLEGIPLGSANRLEGYLFPDTYRFYVNEDPLYAINKMLVNFDSKLTDSMREDMAERGMTVQEAVTIASLIEKETDGTDQGLISSVINNRLANPEVTGGLLQIDAAIYYVTGRAVTQEDYEGVVSPYNTYLNPGLPPTAIANPGSEAIWAAIHPKESNYYYYALGTDGLHHFSRTFQEHQNFLASLPKED